MHVTELRTRCVEYKTHIKMRAFQIERQKLLVDYWRETIKKHNELGAEIEKDLPYPQPDGYNCPITLYESSKKAFKEQLDDALRVQDFVERAHWMMGAMLGKAEKELADHPDNKVEAMRERNKTYLDALVSSSSSDARGKLPAETPE